MNPQGSSQMSDYRIRYETLMVAILSVFISGCSVFGGEKTIAVSSPAMVHLADHPLPDDPLLSDTAGPWVQVSFRLDAAFSSESERYAQIIGVVIECDAVKTVIDPISPSELDEVTETWVSDVYTGNSKLVDVDPTVERAGDAGAAAFYLPEQFINSLDRPCFIVLASSMTLRRTSDRIPIPISPHDDE
jgi:hypothetical protein